MALVFALAGATLMYTSCSKDFGEDIDNLDKKLTSVQSDLSTKLSDLEGRLSTLSSSVNALDAAYKTADDAIKSAFAAADDKLKAGYQAADEALQADINGLKTRVSNIEDAIKDLDKLATKDELQAVKEALEKKIDDDLNAAKAMVLAMAQNLQDQIDVISAALALKADADAVYTKDEVKDILTKYFTQDEINDLLAKKADADAVYTKKEVVDLLAEKADKSAVYTKEEIMDILKDYFTQEEVNALLAKKADADKVYTKDEIAEILSAYYTAEKVDEILENYFTKAQVLDILKDYVTNEELVKILEDYYTKAEIAQVLASYYTKEEMAEVLKAYYTKEEMTEVLSAYYTKDEVADILKAYYTAEEVDNLLKNYYTKQEIDDTFKNYFTKEEIEDILADYYTAAEVDEILEDYYTKSEIDDTFALYYTKEEIEDMLADYYTAAEVDEILENYYTKDEVYTKEEIAEILEDYYTKEEIDDLFTNYYTIAEIDELFENYYDREEIDQIVNDIQDKINEVFELLSDELRSIVFAPDFYFAGIEATSYDFAKFFNYEIVALKDNDTFVVESEDQEASTVYTLLKNAKTTAKLITDKNGAVINTQGQVGKAKYDLNPSTYSTDKASWKLNGDNKEYKVKAADKTWSPKFESIEKDANGLATVTYSIDNPEDIFSSVVGAFPFIYDPQKYNVKDADNLTIRQLFWLKLQNDILNYNNGRKAKTNVPIMQLEATLDTDGRHVVSDWHAVTSFEETVAHLAFADDNEYVTYVEDDCGLADPQIKDLYDNAKDAVLNETNLKIKWNGGAKDLAKYISIHTKDAAENTGFDSYTLEEFNAKYPGYHFEFELVPYTIGKNVTSEDKYGNIEGTMFTPCYVKSESGEAQSIIIEEGSEDGKSSVGRMPVVLVTLVADEDSSIKAYGWFKILISKDDKPDQFYTIPGVGKVPYICGEFNLSTVWHEFSYFVLEALKVDYREFVRTYDYTDIYAYVPTDKGPKFQSVVAASKPLSDGVYYELGYKDAKGKTVSLGRAKYAMDASGDGINDAFSWLVDPIGIGEGNAQDIYFLFVKDDQRVFFKMSAEVIGRAKMDLGLKINKEWYDDIDGEALNTARVNVHVPNADEINPNVTPNALGGDVLDYTRSLQHFFQGYVPQFTLSDDADPLYKNFFNTVKGVDPDAGENNDRFDDPELDTDYDFFFSKEQPNIDNNWQLYSNWWGPGEEVIEWDTEEMVLVHEGQGWITIWINGRPHRVYDEDRYGMQTIHHTETVIYGTGKLLYVGAYDESGKLIEKEVTVDGVKVKVPVALPENFIAYIEPTTTETLNGKDYRADVIKYFPTEPAKKLLNLYPHDATEQSRMLYAHVYVKSAYGECGIDLEDKTFHVRFLRPIDVKFVDQNVAEESAVDGWNVEIAKFLAGITDWNGEKVIVPELDAKGKETGYYVPNVIKKVDMYKYYVFKKLIIDLAEAEVNNIDPNDPEKFFKISDKMPGARLAIGTVDLYDETGKPIEKKDWVFTEAVAGDDESPIQLNASGSATIEITDFNALRGIVINYRNDEGYSDPFTLKIKVGIKYSWGILSDYLYVNVGETTVHDGE